MDKYCIHALESIVRSSEWANTFEPFYRLNCPRFENFEIVLKDLARGKGLDLLTFKVYQEFQNIFEETVNSYLSDMDVSFDAFQKSLEAALKRGDTVGESLLNSFEIYEDFEAFGRMMESKFNAIFGDGNEEKKYGGGSGDGEQLKSGDMLIRQPAKAVECDSPAEPESARRSRYSVRVLWDIENIFIPKSLGGLETVRRMQDFLQTRGLHSPGIDFRIAAFFNPSLAPPRVVRELDKASVEMVWVSSKREDADRKIKTRISQEMMVLRPAGACFVLVSSDQDFRTELQLLSNAGYRVIVIHDAPDGSNWAKAMELHAKEAYRWRDVVGVGGDSGDDDVNGEQQQQSKIDTQTEADTPIGINNIDSKERSDDDPEQRDEENTSSIAPPESSGSQTEADARDDRGDGYSNRKREYKGSGDSSRGRGRGRGGRFNKETSTYPYKTATAAPESAKLTGWHRATCIRWNGPYGFLSVIVASENGTMPSTDTASTSYLAAAKTGAESTADDDITQMRTDTHTIAGTSSSSGGSSGGSGGTTTKCVHVYAHYKSLSFDPPKSGLDRGEAVMVLVDMADKGPRAVIVQSIDGQQRR
jgi:hypothetical protein